jgi:8-amino-7-oxononanoate synthase
LFGLFSPREFAVYLDRGAYAVARWGAERARGRGVQVRWFAHYSTRDLRATFDRAGSADRRPVVVADGFCPACGRSAPLRDYWDFVRARHGYLILDDTQALGILGARAQSARPYGRGGGGSLRRSGVTAPEVILVSSLAKAFGAPLAALSARSMFVDDFEERSQTRMHCSPPAVAAIRAAAYALAVNERSGDVLRRCLARNVGRFRFGLAANGLAAGGGHFPVQTLVRPSTLDAHELHRELESRGVRTVLHAETAGRPARISFILTARHHPFEIDSAVAALAGAVGARRLTHHRSES